ncbi:MAG: hypothetical protein J1F02_01800 [Lachnospiraceae bacterium]|nr:hypothetical protein [Lachnospiraceae bacterium]
MDEQWKKEFFEKLEEHFGAMTQENALEKLDDGEYVLRSLFTTVEGERGLALFETQLYPTNPEVVQLEIMVIPCLALKEERLAELEKAAAHLNYYTPIGALGIFYPRNQMFMRYVALLDLDKSIGELVQEIGKLYELMGVTFGNLYLALEEINDGKLTFEEAVEQNRLLKQV